MHDGHGRPSRDGRQRFEPRRHDHSGEATSHLRKEPSRSPPRHPQGHRGESGSATGHHRPFREQRGYEDEDRGMRYSEHRGTGHRGHDQPSTLTYDDHVDENQSRGRDTRPVDPDRASRWEQDQAAHQHEDHTGGGDSFELPRKRRAVSPGEYSGGSEDEGRHIDRRHRSRSRSGSAPNRPILILEDVPHDATENDIARGLDIATDYGRFSSEIIDVVRFRTRRQGDRIAITEFYDSADAREFASRNRGEISLPLMSRGATSEPVSLPFQVNWPRESRRAAQSRQHDRRRKEDWTCYECSAVNYPDRTYCYRCKVERPDVTYHEPPAQTQHSGPVLTGETDQCPQQVPSQYLVVRGLDSSVNEEVLARSLEHLYLDNPAPVEHASFAPVKAKLKSTAPTKSTAGLGARPNSLRRVFLMRNRHSNDSWKFGFAEYDTLQDAQGAMAKFHGMGDFKINMKPVVVAFIHTGVFVPAFEPSDHGDFAFAPIYNPSLLLKYWDDRGYPSEYTVSTEGIPGADDADNESSTRDPATGNGSGAPGDSSKKPKKDAVPRGKKPVIMAPQLEMWAKKRAEILGAQTGRKPREASESSRKGISAAMASSKPESRLRREPPKTMYSVSRPPADVNAAKRPAPLDREESGERAPHPYDSVLSYALSSQQDGTWSCAVCLGVNGFKTRQALLDHEVLDPKHASSLAEAKAQARLDTEPVLVRRRRPRVRSDAPPEYTSYADSQQLVCLVCDPPRRFTDRHVLGLHETESTMHQDALANPRNVRLAMKRLAKLGQRPRNMRPKATDQEQQQMYRDRARERRIAFNQTAKPKADSNSAGRSRKDAESADDAATKEQQPKLPSKGAALLGKMGWSAGEGLGAAGTGRTDIVATDLYVPGVGLGADGGRVGDAAEEAARNTRGQFSDFVQKTRDRARERYEKMG